MKRTKPTPRSKHDVILAAAKRVFLREGFARASVDAIAAEGDVSKQTIYNHFGDKERLFLAVIEEVQGRPSLEQDKALDALFRAGKSPEAVLRKVGQTLLSILYREDLASFRRLVIAEAAHYPQLRLAWIRGGPLTFMIRLTGYLAEQTAAGALDIRRPERAARQFLALLASDGNDQSMFGSVPLSPAQIDVIVEDALEMFLRAYRPRV